MEILVNIDVDDLSEAIAFYERAFGLRVGRRFDQFVEMLGGSSTIYLLEKRAGTRPTPDSEDLRRYKRHWTPVHLDFVVSDIEGAVERAAAAGATEESEITAHAWGRIALMADPFGHGICVIQFTGRGYGEIAQD